MKTGLLGGTFDPVHNGHLLAAKAAERTYGLDRVVFVPAACSPHKGDKPLSPGAIRLSMIEAAIEGEGSFEVSRTELDRPPPSYTYDTLTWFRQKFPRDELFFIIGADALRELHLWYRAAELVAQVRVITVARPGYPIENFKELTEHFGSETASRLKADALFIEGVDISATEIRNQVRKGKPIAELVPASVAKIIEAKALYRI